MKAKKNLLLLLGIIVLFSCNETEKKQIENTAQVYFGGDIITMKGISPEYAEALVENNGKIIFVGSLEMAKSIAGENYNQKNLEGKTLLPGFLDGHSHYSNSLMVANQCMLYAPPSGSGADVPSIIATLKKFASERDVKDGEMITGYGYDDTVMPNGRLLNRDDLDKAFPNNPVRIDHVSMHGTVLNSKAMDYYDISAETETPSGGIIVRKPGTNEPYGLIMETAYKPIAEKIEKMTLEQEIEATKAGQMLYAKEGITTAQEGFTLIDNLETIKAVSDAGVNIIDVVAYPFVTEIDKSFELIPQSQWLKYNNNFKIGGIKITIDGSPQGRTAAFTTPYLTGGPAGEKNWHGELTFSKELVNKAVKRVYDLKLPLILHCNGDAAIDTFLESYEYVRNGDYSQPWNVTTIHTQFMRKDHISKFVKFGIRPSFYTLHTYYFYEAHLANRGLEQAQYISPMRDAIDAGLKPSNHTDFVVAPLDQMFMLYSAVNRISRAGAKVGSSQRVTPFEGLLTMTRYTAEQYDEIDSKGTLEIGKRADLVILDKNPLKTDPLKIKDIKVVETIKDGKTIFKE
ncbi:amidohydrolase [Lacinutrix jangbogonensis]|uniref:amidohydrolase n=1 Tax=Lacinutrix jangbogonensis TaxID=1469557 RepID=UPI0009DF27FF|nr:amidohydrolase [Lacinutrix jangbogonensis]